MTISRKWSLGTFCAIAIAGLVATAAHVRAQEQPHGLGPYARELEIGPGMKAAGEDLRYSRLIGVDLTGADFTGADLRLARFDDCTLTSASFRKAKLGGAIIDGCTIDNADFTGADINQEYRGGTIELTPEQLKSTESYRSKKLIGCAVKLSHDPSVEFDFRGFTIDRCHLYGLHSEKTVDYTDAFVRDYVGLITFQQLASTKSFKQNWLEGLHPHLAGPADLSNKKFVRSGMRGSPEAVFENTRFVGSCHFGHEFTAAQIQATRNYREGDLSNMGFTGIDFSNVDFSGQNLTSARFSQCELAGAQFDDAVISGAAFEYDVSIVMDLTADQIRSTWNFKHGRLHGVVLPPPLDKEFADPAAEKTKAE